MRELTDDELDAIVRKTWGNGWMLPGEPQRMLVRAGYAAGYAAAQADARRYRWLRDKARSEGRDGGWTGIYTLPVVPAWDETSFAAARHEAFHHKTLDAAIDAAIVKMKP